MSDLTRILLAAAKGDEDANKKLLPLVYAELRQLASHKLAREKPGQTLQSTALVHEAYLRLVGDGPSPAWENRSHFFAAAAEAMRRILIDVARAKGAKKRGGELERMHLDNLDVEADESYQQVLAVDRAVDQLAEIDANQAQIVKLRFFVGLSIPEAAEAMQISVPTANRYWAKAKVWLHRELQDPDKE